MNSTALARSTRLQLTRTLGKAMSAAIAAWADATTDASSRRRRDLLRDKVRALADFFEFVGVPAGQVGPIDVKDWQAELEQRQLAPSTVYGMISRLSSFYTWAAKDPRMAEQLPHNPVDLARPKAPKAYQSDSTKALDDGQVLALLAEVRARAEGGDLVGKRDYALLLHYLLTGRRRAEVLGLRWGDLRMNGVMVATYRVKGGELDTRIVRDPTIRAAMVDYLAAAGRLEGMTEETPIWTRHDRAGKPGGELSSHAFVKNLKRYAQDAGVGELHLHQLRHTFARMAGDESGSLGAVQEALGHKSQVTTRVYLQRVGVKSDKFSSALAERLGVP